MKFHEGDRVIIRKISNGAPIETLGMQGYIHKVYGGEIGFYVKFLTTIKNHPWSLWAYTQDELELVQEAPHGHT